MADIFQEGEPIGEVTPQDYADPQFESADPNLSPTPAARQDAESGIDESDDKQQAAYRANLLQTLQGTKPRWMEGGSLGDRIPVGPNPIPIPEWDTEIKSDRVEFQPNPVTQETTEETTAETNEYGFKLSLGDIDADAYTIEIHVGYGEINDEPPDGMTLADDYDLTIPGADDGTEIYAIITYDTDTLEITSRSLASGLVVPDNTYGTLYVSIGTVKITYGDLGVIATVVPRNRHCGDINVALIYGSVNDLPALFALNQLADPIEVPV